MSMAHLDATAEDLLPLLACFDLIEQGDHRAWRDAEPVPIRWPSLPLHGVGLACTHPWVQSGVQGLEVGLSCCWRKSACQTREPLSYLSRSVRTPAR
jgi:hypothetical protein